MESTWMISGRANANVKSVPMLSNVVDHRPGAISFVLTCEGGRYTHIRSTASPVLYVCAGVLSATASGSAKQRVTQREPQPGETRQTLVAHVFPEQ
jgi:hypothetical protein